MKDPLNTPQSSQRQSRSSFFARIEKAKIEGERRRQSKMTSAQRSVDFTARKIFVGVLTVITSVMNLVFLIGVFIAFPIWRIPLAGFVALNVWLVVRKERGRTSRGTNG